MVSQHADLLNAAAAAAAIVTKNKTKLLTGIDAGAAISTKTCTGAVIAN
jgi:hypothetical protein